MSLARRRCTPYPRRLAKPAIALTQRAWQKYMPPSRNITNVRIVVCVSNAACIFERAWQKYMPLSRNITNVRIVVCVSNGASIFGVRVVQQEEKKRHLYLRTGIPNALAKPKSASFSSPSRLMRRFWGLRSRCNLHPKNSVTHT